MTTEPTNSSLSYLEAQREAIDRLIEQAEAEQLEQQRAEQQRLTTEREQQIYQFTQQAEGYRQQARHAQTDAERRELYRFAAEADQQVRVLQDDTDAPDPDHHAGTTPVTSPVSDALYYLRTNALRLVLSAGGFYLAVHSGQLVQFGTTGVALEGDVRFQQLLFTLAAFLGLEAFVSLLTLIREPELASYANPRLQTRHDRRTDLSELSNGWQRLLAWYGPFSLRMLMLVYLYSRMCG